jgi:ribonuclease HI
MLSGGNMRNKKKYYAVQVGRKPGIYKEWYGKDGAERQIKGFSGAIYKGFVTKEKAVEFLQNSFIKTKNAKYSLGENDSEFDLRNKRVVMYTDGGCISNPGPGGYGIVLLDGRTRKELSGGYRLTTNNRMELIACITGLKALEAETPVIIYSDSKYVVDGISKGWAYKWRKNGWKKPDNKPAENTDLWEELLGLCREYEVEFIWVKGHEGIEENERCDDLARKAALQGVLMDDEGYPKK